MRNSSNETQWGYDIMGDHVDQVLLVRDRCSQFLVGMQQGLGLRGYVLFQPPVPFAQSRCVQLHTHDEQ